MYVERRSLQRAGLPVNWAGLLGRGLAGLGWAGGLGASSRVRRRVDGQESDPNNGAREEGVGWMGGGHALVWCVASVAFARAPSRLRPTLQHDPTTRQQGLAAAGGSTCLVDDREQRLKLGAFAPLCSERTDELLEGMKPGVSAFGSRRDRVGRGVVFCKVPRTTIISCRRARGAGRRARGAGRARTASARR